MKHREIEGLITQTQAAKLLRRSVRTLTLWRRRHYGPAFLRIGGAVMYTAEDLSGFLRTSRIELGLPVETGKEHGENPVRCAAA
jgi:hypothetical protein